MSKHKNLKRNLLICLLAGSAVMYTLPLHAATSVIANNTLPSGGQFVHGEGNIASSGLEMNITQNGQNAVIKWNDFSVGGNATVNFDYTGKDNFNTLNYVNSGKVSQIYGTINAQHEGYNGNIFIVNTAGVQIGPSAQINVGSLHVSSNTLDDNSLKNFYDNAHKADFALGGTGNADAVLMSLGNINATNVTFEGDGRIVIDSERIKNSAGDAKLTADKILVNTKDKNNVVIGYEAYDETNGYGKVDINTAIATVNGSAFTKANGYMWVEDVEQLQAIGKNANTLSGNYALRNSIDATSTEQNGFTSIGSDDSKAFTGNFDGIDYNIFGLTIKNGGENTGLFGYTNNATISNVTLVGGSITGSNNVGAIVGNANNTTLTNVVNSAAVSGNSNVGGIVGSATGTTVEDAINTGAIEGIADTDNGGINVGGLIGSMNNSDLIGNSYNLGDVSGNGHNVGGLVGSASNSTIGNPSVVNGKPVENIETVYNRMDVTGAYNVGGIVGNMEGTAVQNAENSGTVTATGHTTENYIYHSDYTVDGHNKHNAEGKDDTNGHYAVATVNVANVGGIAGTSSADSTITDVLNTGDVSSSKVKEQEQEYYAAGNVGGIVGSAVDTNITNATNRENEVRGAHNVGGVAGYFGSTKGDSTNKDTPHYTVTNGINDGGDIMATGARYGNDFVRETIRHDYNAAADSNNDGKYIVGNIGGVIGYMDGNNVYVTNSANRGTVHTLDITDQSHISDASTAANVGGVVGKIDRGNTITINSGNVNEAAVSNSYNTGDVRGYTAIGGIVGMMYNGEIAGSYNLGNIMSTRISAGGTIPLNMGGIVGDTTENSSARAYLYDVYNKGQIGDETYTYKGRHVGGIAGRLSGTIEKAYNAGEIYNAAAVTGGIVGYMSAGRINNVFNTGNITVVHNDGADVGVQLGGLVGAANIGRGNTTISNAYNLGVIRAFEGQEHKATNGVGGVVGTVVSYKGISGESEGELYIKNVYTTGDLYSENGEVGAVYGSALENVTTTGQNSEINIDNVVYITRSNTTYDKASTQGAYEINYSGMNDDESWITFIAKANGLGSGSVDLDSTSGLWRVYDGTTPILNEYLPNSKKYFDEPNNIDGITNIQYGTAYNPLLTIIEASKDLSFDWQDLGINNDAGLAVYGAGVTLDNFKATGGTGYYGGTIYADGNLKLDGNRNDISLGSASQIYGSSVTIETDGKVTIYGDVTATGGESAGDITVTGGDVDVYGQLTSATEGEATNIAGIGKEYGTINNVGEIANEYDDIANMGDHYAHTTGEAAENGDITIKATETKLVVDDNGNPILDAEGNEQYVDDGDVNIYYGNKEHGLITTGGDLTVTGTGDVYVDSDLDIGGNLTLNGTGAESEVVLDITNIGQVQADNGTVKDALTGLHNFMHHFENNKSDTDKLITLNSASGDAKLAVDMWNYGTGAFDLNKYDDTEPNGHTLLQELQKLNISASVIGNDGKVTTSYDAQDSTYIWVSSGEQLKNIQTYYKTETDAGRTTGILGYNFALKNDINASGVTNYEAIGTNSVNGFTGTFDGRGNRIIGLNVSATDSANNNTNAGIFSTVGTDGVVKDVNIYSGNFTGTTNAGAVAGVNNGRIEGVKTFGNTVKSNGNAGGIVGVNTSGEFSKVDNTTGSTNGGKLTGGIYDVESTGSVIAGSNSANAGGLVGTNGGALGNTFSDSAVTVQTGVSLGASAGLGGVVGVNNGDVQIVDSLGVTNGGATNSSNIGGIIGINNGNMYSGYNESIVSGKDNVGGIIGTNAEGKKVENVVNATGVEGKDNVGGLVGVNSGSVTNGRNNGTITGNEYVGGLVGNNASKNSVLTNLVNDSSAAITGERYVGGIAGSNAGTITTGNEETDKTVNLINRGTITGQQYVGGVAGSNSGIITNANNDVELNVKDSTADAKFFGGIAGENTKGGIIKNATNTADVNADGATYVGGIVGKNDGTLENMAGNSGNVTGENYVGGVAGQNTNNKPLNGVEASNTGTVFATAGGAGGIFAVNNADITNSKLTNNGTVIGNSGNGTGGIFGVNTGNISTSSLINEVDGQVIGTNNVGGLIGVNTGNIEGGRYTVAGEDAGMYINKIYNNGVINVGAYIYNNKNGEYEFKVGTGSNIGGLIGDNQGSLTAGYNTGAINASGSTNVGGIAGSNSGTIDQVFNTVMTPDNAVKPDGSKQEASITGGTNVGGLIGNNTGTLSNAYNTTEVSGNAASTGNLVGTNSGTVQYVYGYGVDSIDELIGEVTGTGSISHGHAIGAAENSWFQQDVYEDFPFDANGWKIYDGSTLPMLSVFLTKVTVVDQHLVNQYFSAKHYGEFHQITADDIKALIAIGAISAPDGFGAFNNNNGLIQGVADDAIANSGNWLYSQQILGSNINGLFNPNNLGYDISLVYSPFELDNDPSSHWNYLFNDAPFDRNKDFRERKAEVNFVDGGMEI
ncbi:hypothetical protein QUV50_02960 [Phascolarctobacterium faecium]|nr:hypothetical protein [Phascolarctobacterium faecium]MDM8110745.1 hypothetical protein [Phascolarctobacterium faecium]